MSSGRVGGGRYRMGIESTDFSSRGKGKGGKGKGDGRGRGRGRGRS